MGRRTRNLCVTLCVLSVACSGCWSLNEPVDITVASAFAAESAPQGQLLMTVELVNPASATGEGGGAEHPTRVMQATGNSLFEAVRRLDTTVGKCIFLANVEAIVVGRSLAESRGITPVLDWITRQHQLRQTLLLVLGDGDVGQILATRVLRDTASQELTGLIGLGKITGFVTATTANEFIIDFALPGIEPVLPVASLVDIPQVEPIGQDGGGGEGADGTDSGLSRGGGPQGGVRPPAARDMPKAIRMDSMALFRGDRLVGILRPYDSRGLLWLRGGVSGTIISVPARPAEGYTSVEIVKASTSIRPQTEGGRISSFVIKIDATGEVADVPVMLDEPGEAERLREIKQQTEQAIKTEAENALRMLQNVYHVDSIGFGLAIYRREPRLWRQIEPQWHDVFQTIPWTIETNVTLRSTGVVLRSLHGKQTPQQPPLGRRILRLLGVL